MSTILLVILSIVVVLFLFTVLVIGWLAAPLPAENTRYAWLPVRIWEQDGGYLWHDTRRYVVFEWVGVYKTLWGKTVHFRLK